MRVPTIAVGGTQAVATVSVYAQGAYGQAVAALLAMRGNRVACLGAEAKNWQCDVTTQSRARYSATAAVHSGADGASVRGSDAVVLAVPATAYGAVCEDIVAHLNSRQTLFVVGAAFGAALEISRLLQERRRDLTLPVIEVGQPFATAYCEGQSMIIKQARDSFVISGCSLNETRAGLLAGGPVFNALVPASNLIERAFCDIDRWLDTGALLFEVFGTRPAAGVLAGLKNELLAIGKAYGMNRLAEPVLPINGTAAGADAEDRLAERIIEDYGILSSLARLRYVSVPVLDGIIELASATLGVDLRREARELSDLGLIGMDADEIIEHVSA